MHFDLGNQLIVLTCPKCGFSVEKTFQWARSHNELRCRCGRTTAFNTATTIDLVMRSKTFSSKFETSGFNFTRRT